MEFDQFNTVACSSTNSESLVQFNIRSLNTQVIANLYQLAKRGFIQTKIQSQIEGEKDYYELKGQIIHVFPDTSQLFYNEIVIKYTSSIDISTNAANEAQITQINIQQQGLSSTHSTSFVVAVVLDDDPTQTGQLEVAGDFTISVSLPAGVTSKYTVTVPAEAKFYNAETIQTVALTQEASTTQNQYLINVPLTNTDGDAVPDCELALDQTLLRRLFQSLTRFLSTQSTKAGLIIDKSFSINRTNTNTTSNMPTVYDNPEQIQESEDTMSMNVGIILLIVLSGLVAIALILGIVYYAVKIQKNRQMREKMEAAKHSERGQEQPQQQQQQQQQSIQQQEIEIEELQLEIK